MQSLVDLIRAAFPDVGPYPGEMTGHEPFAHDIRQAFQDLPWPELTDRQLDRNTDAFVDLDPEPLAHYLPAFLSHAVRNPNSRVAEFLVFFLASLRFQELMRLLSRDQIQACFAAAEFIFDHDGGLYAKECEVVMSLREELVRDGHSVREGP